MRRLLLIALLLVLGPPARSQPVSPAQPLPEVRADRFEVDFASGAAVWRGNARVELPEGLLTADELRYVHGTRTVEARGNVILTQGPRRLLAHEMSYGLDSRTYRVRNLRFGTSPVYVSGSLVEGDQNVLHFSDAVVSYGEPGRWAPTFVADSLTLHPERHRMRARGAALGLGLWQPVPLPATELPTHLSFLAYLSVGAGYSRTLGAHLNLGLQVPVGESLSLGGDVGLFSARGILIGPSGTYHYNPGTTSEAVGEFSSGYINDTGDRQGDVLRDPVPRDRGFARWSHRQRLGPRLTLGALLNYWSDSEVLRDFRPREFFPVQTPDSFAELNYLADNAIIGLFLRPHLNRFHSVRERLPELSFHLLPSPLAAGLYHEWQASAARLQDDPPTGGPTLRSDRFDTYYALSRPYTPRDWFTFAPVAGVRVTHYERALGGLENYTRTLGEFGFDSEMRASGTFDYRNDRWRIDGLRHLVTPRVSYRYIPNAEKGVGSAIPQVDRRVFATYLEPLGLGSRRQIDDLAPTNTLRLALDNRLQTRDAELGSRDLAQLNLAADLRFDRLTGERTLSDLHTEVRLHPARWLTFDAYHRLHPHGRGTQEFNAGITLLHADRWALRLGNHYLQGDARRQGIQEHLLGFTYQMNEVWGLYTRVHYDARLERFNEQVYGIRQTIDNRWVVGYQVAFFDGPRRESNFGFSLQLDTISW
jgi:LPS-assembly protein